MSITRPTHFLSVLSGHADAGEAALGVSVGGLQTAEKPVAVSAKTVLKMLLDDHSSSGT